MSNPRVSVRVATAVACQGNPGRGAWAAVLRHPDDRVTTRSGVVHEATHNRLTLLGPADALGTLPKNLRVTVVSAARYPVDGMTKWLPLWKKRTWRNANGHPVANADLWEQLDHEATVRTLRWKHAPVSRVPDLARARALAEQTLARATG